MRFAYPVTILVAVQEEPVKIVQIAPFTIEAEKKNRLRAIAKQNHRDLTSQIRFLIDECIAEHSEDAA